MLGFFTYICLIKIILNKLKITVAQLKPGQKGIIEDFSIDDVPVKLLELGCLPGNTVEMVQVAPLRDPIYINVNGSHIAIRKDMASRIKLKALEDSPSP